MTNQQKHPVHLIVTVMVSMGEGSGIVVLEELEHAKLVVLISMLKLWVMVLMVMLTTLLHQLQVVFRSS